MKKTGMARVAVILACGLTGCSTLLGSGRAEDSEERPVYSEAIEVVYREIPYSELDEAINKVNSPGKGFVVEGYFVNADTPRLAYRISDTSNGTPWRWFYLHNGRVYDTQHNYVTPHQFETYNDQTYRRIDKTKKYKIFIGVYQRSDNGYWVPFIDKIEGLWTWEEVAVIEEKQKAEEEKQKAELEAKQKAEAEAKQKAEEAKQKAEAIAREAKFNPNKFNRSQYKETTAQEFTFDMAAEKFNVGTKISFTTTFVGKPTGIHYHFGNVDRWITFSTTHNFVRDMPESCFGWGIFFFQSPAPVKIFVTVKKTGQSAECSVDIVEW
jgi:hypothetical protein